MSRPEVLFPLFAELTVLDGVGPKLARVFARMEITRPVDLLLTLLGKHELDITEIALSKVTDEFISYLKGLDDAEELEQASEFLVVAATLLDMKVAGLLPQGEGAMTVVGDPAQVQAIDSGGLVVSESGRMVAVVGLEDVVVVETDDALLVASRERAQDVKLVVEALKAAGRTDLV